MHTFFNSFHVIVHANGQIAKCTFFLFVAIANETMRSYAHLKCKNCGNSLRERKFHWMKKKRFINQWHSFVNRHYFRRYGICKCIIVIVSFEHASSCVCRMEIELHTANNIRNKFLYTIWSMRMLLFFSSIAFCIQTLSLYIWIAMQCDKNHIHTFRRQIHTYSHWITIYRYSAFTYDKRSKRSQ